MLGLLRLGNLKLLDSADVPPIPPTDQAGRLVAKFSQAWEAQKQRGRPHSVLQALFVCLWKDILFTGILAFLKACGLILGPIFLYFFVDYASGNLRFEHEGVALVVGIGLVKLVENFSQRHWFFGMRRLGMKVQSTVMAAVYEKELRLSNVGKRNHSTGEIVNYISVDAYRLCELIWQLHWAWVVPFVIMGALGILFAVVGLAAIPGLVLVIVFILLNTPLILAMQTCQGQFMIAQDQRLRATIEILSGMKVIKLQAWEEKFGAFIQRMRDVECKWLDGTQRRRNYATVLYWSMPTIVTSVVLVTCILLNMELTYTVVFTVLATFRIIQDPIRSVPDVLSTFIQARVSLQRLDRFLVEDELSESAVQKDVSHVSEYAVRVDGATLSWDPMDARPTLRDINLVVKRGHKVAVCGTIGSGKSTLLQSFLGEITKVAGKLELSGRVAYVAQTAWIQTGSVKDNILFGLPYDDARYKMAVKACALEQDIRSFSHGDLTEIGERGINMSGGQKQRIQLARAVYNDADIYLLDDPFSAVDAQTAAMLFGGCVMGALREKTVVLVTHQVEFLPAVDSILVMENGEIRHSGSYDDLLLTGDVFRRLVAAHQEALHSVSNGDHQHRHHLDQPTRSDSTLAVRTVSKEQLLAKKSSLSDDFTPNDQLVQEELRESGTNFIQPYLDYVRISGAQLEIVGAVLGQIAFSVVQLFNNVWLATQLSNSEITTQILVGVFAGTSVFAVALFYFRSKMVVDLGLKASDSFFRGLSGAIMKAPMSFFDSTPSGRILNRVSVDVSMLDLDIPFTFGNALALASDMVTMIILIAVATWEILLVVLPAFLLIQYMQNFYSTPAREMSRLNATTKAPIVNNSAETISGSATIRSFNVIDQFKQKNLQLIDKDASLFFHKHAALEWLVLRIEISCTAVVTCAALLVLLRSDISPGLAGLSITYALALNNCQIYLSFRQCTLAIFIIAVERIKQYMTLPMEAPAIIESNRPPPQWPTKGSITLDDLHIRYRPKSPMVLKKITCTFEGGHKIGVVGRTGSGKTTLISALFRLVEPAAGRICVDGIDICTIGLHDLRFKLCIIPQEPVLFRGTVRTNLDPLNQFSDLDIWEALGKCQLGDVIRSLPIQLESPVTEQGENWSAGQRQLFCLGRVLLKRSQVLVLDEATASIDATTDAILQKIIREEFSACTVVTVAHRIPSVIDSDMVLALKDGVVAEYAPPRELMEKKERSLFAQLVAEYWAQDGRRHQRD